MKNQKRKIFLIAGLIILIATMLYNSLSQPGISDLTSKFKAIPISKEKIHRNNNYKNEDNFSLVQGNGLRSGDFYHSNNNENNNGGCRGSP